MIFISLLEHCGIFPSANQEFIAYRSDGYVEVSLRIFNDIKDGIINHTHDIQDVLSPVYVKSFGEVIKSKNYVGVIEISSHISIEILPKIAQGDIQMGRTTLLKMLQCGNMVPQKIKGKASVHGGVVPIMDLFIEFFCNELENLLSQGIMGSYERIVDNSPTLKGRLSFHNHIVHNSVRKDRFFIEFDEYGLNCFEHRVIKSALLLLYEKVRIDQIKQRLREFLVIFKEIPELRKGEKVRKYSTAERNEKRYNDIMQWAILFLQGNSIFPRAGELKGVSLLFDMNSLFEKYVQYHLKKQLHLKCGVTISPKTAYMVTEPQSLYRLAPDMLIGRTIIADMKWKRISSMLPDHRDMYQMYVYGKKYEGIREIHLIYPYTDECRSMVEYLVDDTLTIRIFPFDCITAQVVTDKLSYVDMVEKIEDYHQ